MPATRPVNTTHLLRQYQRLRQQAGSHRVRYIRVRGQVRSYALRAESIRFCPQGVGVSLLTIWREATARTVDAACLTVG